MKFIWEESWRKGKEKEGSYFILNEIKWICLYEHSPNNHSLNSTAKLLAMLLSNAFYLSNIFSKAWFLEDLVSAKHIPQEARNHASKAIFIAWA